MSHILDISRFVSRAHLPFDTGIDRVERAFVLDTLQRFAEAYFIARIGQWFVILDAEGMHQFLHLEANQCWPRSQGQDIFRLKLPRQQRRVRTALRNIARIHTKIENLPAEIKALGIGAYCYTNVGHSNLSAMFFETMRTAGARNISAFVHDVIPLDFPQYCRANRLKPFAENMQNIMDYCDQIYCNSQYTADRVSFHFNKTPKLRVVHLPNHEIQQNGRVEPIKFERPTFAMLGTIEPRKNLTFILDVWDLLAEKLPPDLMPDLIIIGKRGWEKAETLDRMSRAKNVRELNTLSDADVQAHLSACVALLFPSHVEGYGLPAQEAIALGVPVIASDIPVFRELFADTATLLAITQAQVWVDFIQNVLLNPDNMIWNADCSIKIKVWDDFFTEIY